MERWCTGPLELPLVRGGTAALQLPSVRGGTGALQRWCGGAALGARRARGHCCAAARRARGHCSAGAVGTHLHDIVCHQCSAEAAPASSLTPYDAALQVSV